MWAYSPCGVLEEELVRSIIETRWQLRRANMVDSELFQIYSVYEGQKRGVGTAFAQDATQGNAFTKLTRYQNDLHAGIVRLAGADCPGPRVIAVADRILLHTMVHDCQRQR